MRKIKQISSSGYNEITILYLAPSLNTTKSPEEIHAAAIWELWELNCSRQDGKKAETQTMNGPWWITGAFFSFPISSSLDTTAIQIRKLHTEHRGLQMKYFFFFFGSRSIKEGCHETLKVDKNPLAFFFFFQVSILFLQAPFLNLKSSGRKSETVYVLASKTIRGRNLFFYLSKGIEPQRG